MEEGRLPAHVEAAALIRRVSAAGGFATVLHKGQREAGTLLLVLTENGDSSRVYERMPQADGSRVWVCARHAGADSGEFSDYLDRRTRQDPDLWVIELDIVRAERFIGLETPED